MKDGKYLTAAEKEKLARAWRRFVQSGFRRSLFIKGLYKILHVHMGFIAHYNQDGFYVARFADPDARIETLKHFLAPEPWRFNDADSRDLTYAFYAAIRDDADRLLAEARAYKKTVIEARIAGLQDELEGMGA